MNNDQFNAAKQRLGAEATPSTDEATLAPESPPVPTDPNLVFDHDGFLVGVKVHDKSVSRGRYVLNDGKFVGCPFQYRALLSIDYFLLKDSPIASRMSALGLDAQDDAVMESYLTNLSGLEINQIYVESSKLIVIEAVEKPVLTDAPPERCPPNRISIHDLSLTDILSLRAEIEKLSGVDEQDATFREVEAADTEPSSADESDDSGADSQSVGESAE